MNKQILAPLNVKNKNERIYSEANFVNLKESYLLEMYNPLLDPHPMMGHVVGEITNLTIENSNLVGDVKIIETGILPDEVLGDFVVRPKGKGILEDDGSVKDYELMGFQLIPKTEDAFNPL